MEMDFETGMTKFEGRKSRIRITQTKPFIKHFELNSGISGNFGSFYKPLDGFIRLSNRSLEFG